MFITYYPHFSHLLTLLTLLTNPKAIFNKARDSKDINTKNNLELVDNKQV